MKQQRTKNTNKGITLIALVITIIVMLILVAVTISMAVNGGLFEYAENAASETKNALNAEQNLANGGIEVNGEWYSSINEYLNKDNTDVPIELISFNFYGPLAEGATWESHTLYAEKGMTWGQFIESDYNTNDYWYASNRRTSIEPWWEHLGSREGTGS